MTTALTYAIKFVGNMDAAVQFHVAQLGLTLRFESPEWSEFETGQTTLALHKASAEHPAGTVELGFGVPDIERFFATQTSRGTQIVAPPTDLHGQRIMKLRDADGAEISVSGAG
jgi:lactoylglutathione lyase